MTEKKPEIRVRIAPSPTGYFHIGTARTALFNWLFARHNGGKFIVRIEDTDLERSEKKYEEDILAGLKWLGLDWDAGPFRQTDRLDIYEKHLNDLLEKGHAYHCFCTKEELDAEREAMMAGGEAPVYNGRCGKLDKKTAAENIKAGKDSVIRFRIPERVISFKDVIRGEVEFDGSLIGDVVIAKNTRAPLYNFAVVVDDYDMRISHVIRGEEHLANTPRQIFIQKALGFTTPAYAHLPLILNPDRSKMSKRMSATAVNDYKDQGYLAETLVNFIALLGWHASGDKELFTREELIKEFDLARVQKAGAVFNIEKLDWLNARYIKNLADGELAGKLGIEATPRNLKIVAATKDRMRKLSDFKEAAGFFFKLPDYDAKLLAWKKSTKEKAIGHLKKELELLSVIKDMDFTKEGLEKTLMPYAEANGKGDVLWPLRVALSGLDASPGPFELADALGKKESLGRLGTAINKLTKNEAD